MLLGPLSLMYCVKSGARLRAKLHDCRSGDFEPVWKRYVSAVSSRSGEAVNRRPTWSRTSYNRLRCPNHQPRHRYACFHTQFGLGDLGPQPREGEQLLYVGAGVAVTAVQSQTIVEIGPACDRVLERANEEAVRPQCCCCCCYDVFQLAEIHESVARHNQVECFQVIAQVLR